MDGHDPGSREVLGGPRAELTVVIADDDIGTRLNVCRVLESLGRGRAALIACSAALATELSWPHLVGWHVAGGALAVGATVGILLTVPPLLVLLSRSGRVLATTLWIH